MNDFAPVGTVRLKPGREASLARRHPWLYRGALATPAPVGGPVSVEDAAGRPLGVALPGGSGGSLALRMLAIGAERWDATALRGRLDAAARLRARLALDADAYRLVHAEGDRLPGLVVDRYADAGVIELFEPAWEPYLGILVDWLAEQGMARVLLRRAFARPAAVEALRGPVPAQPVTVREGSVRLLADLAGGQKTGLFLDQRENRRRVAALAAGVDVLNLFSYSAAFSVHALAGGARRSLNVDASAPALELARATYRANGRLVDDADFVRGDAFRVTRDLVASAAHFGVVVLDPPALVKRRGELPSGLRGYKDANLQAIRLVAPGGLLLTCSCSALVSEEDFAGAIYAAALDAGCDVRVLERRAAGPDHPLDLFCPETRHLKAWLCEVGARA